MPPSASITLFASIVLNCSNFFSDSEGESQRIESWSKAIREDRLKYDKMIAQVILDYKINGKRSLDSLNFYKKHLDRHFNGFKAVEIRVADIREYIAKRQMEKAKNSTINRELSLLRRAFNLARMAGDLVYAPHIENLPEDNVRQGFLNPAEFVKLHDNLPDYLKPIVEFLYLTGMRVGAARGLQHKDVDLEAGVLRLPAELAKNKRSQVIPLRWRLLDLVKQAYENRSLECPYLFQHCKQPIGDFRKAFDTAADAAGVKGILVHDLRRSAVRNFIRPGIKETVAMTMSGHRTRSIFDRYNIVSSDDLVEANEKLQAFLAEAVKESKVEKLKE